MIFTSAIDNPVQPPFPLIDACPPVTEVKGETAPPSARRGYCRDRAEQRAVRGSFR